MAPVPFVKRDTCQDLYGNEIPCSGMAIGARLGIGLGIVAAIAIFAAVLCGVTWKRRNTASEPKSTDIDLPVQPYVATLSRVSASAEAEEDDEGRPPSYRKPVPSSLLAADEPSDPASPSLQKLPAQPPPSYSH